jgi:hypothetical protein
MGLIGGETWKLELKLTAASEACLSNKSVRGGKAVSEAKRQARAVRKTQCQWTSELIALHSNRPPM